MQTQKPASDHSDKEATGIGSKRQSARSQNEDAAAFSLQAFFPYLVRVYYKSVSQSVHHVYSREMGLTVSEWRTMAVLGPDRTLSAMEIVRESSMDKVNVSRAVAGLKTKELIIQSIDSKDRRKSVLRLSRKGCDGYSRLIPNILEMESKLLDGLSEAEVATLLRLMEKVRSNAERVEQE